MTTTEMSAEPKKYPEISVIGFSRLQDPTYDKRMKRFWATILIVVTGACLWQMKLCFDTYFRYEVIKDLSQVRTSNMTFPVIYICPGFMRSIVFALIKPMQEEMNNETDKNLHKNLMKIITERVKLTSTDEFWTKELGIPDDAINLYRPCTDLMSENCTEYGEHITVNISKVATFWGTCSALSSNINVNYQGPFTYLKLVYQHHKHTMSEELEQQVNQIKKSVDEIENAALLLFLRSELLLYNSHELFFQTQFVIEGFMTHYEINMKKFQYLNVKTEPCFEESNYTRCISNCIDKKVNGTCRMPYFSNTSNSEMKICDFNGVHEAYVEDYKHYLNFNINTCKCRQDCYYTRYVSTANVVDSMKNNSTTQVKFFFGDSAYEETLTRLAYTWSNLISDIGGTLGFFLGFCSLSVIEFVEFFIVWISRRIQ